MLSDIFTKQQTITTGDETYILEFDNKAYAMTEHRTGKSVFELFYGFIEGKPLLNECLEALHCALLKNYTNAEIKKITKEFAEKRYLLMRNLPAISFAFIEGLLPPSMINKQDTKPMSLKKRRKEHDRPRFLRLGGNVFKRLLLFGVERRGVLESHAKKILHDFAQVCRVQKRNVKPKTRSFSGQGRFQCTQ